MHASADPMGGTGIVPIRHADATVHSVSTTPVLLEGEKNLLVL